MHRTRTNHFFLGGLLGFLACVGCDDQATLEIRAALPTACVSGTASTLRLQAVGDFPPEPSQVASAPTGRVALPISHDTKGIELELDSASGPVAFGRSTFIAGAAGDVPALASGAARSLGIAVGAPQTLCKTGNLNYPRVGHSATLLDDGSVLLAGGHDAAGFGVAVFEHYVPGDGAFVAISPDSALLELRQTLGHAVVRLASGEVLLSGGVAAQAGAAAGIAADALIRLSPSLATVGNPQVMRGGPRAYHTATLLVDGRVFLAGGCDQLLAGACASAGLTSTLYYDPMTQRFSDGPTLPSPLLRHTAVAQADGNVVLVGSGATIVVDTTANSARSLGIAANAATRLAVGSLVVIDNSGNTLLYDDISSTSQSLPAALTASAVLSPLDDGGFLAFSNNKLFAFDGHFAKTPIAFPTADVPAQAPVRLTDGTVLVTGSGASADSGAVGDAYLYFHTPPGPLSSFSTFTFDALPVATSLTRPMSVTVTDGQLTLTESQTPSTPKNLALFAPLSFASYALDVIVTPKADATAAIVVDYDSPSHFSYLRVATGKPLVIFTDETAVANCSSQTSLTDTNLHITYQDNRFHAESATASVTCTLVRHAPRTFVGIGVLTGTTQFDNLTITR